MNIFFRQTGPLIRYLGENLVWITDLNPELSTQWRMSRRERLLCGLRFIWTAIKP